MPVARFNGKIIIVQSQTDAERAVEILSKEKIVGIDTETKPVFKKGVTNNVALLQVSTFDICFLFRLNFIGICEPIIKFLNNSNVLKIGIALKNDIQALHMREDFNSKQFIDLQNYVAELGIKDMSLKKVYANVFGQKISKAQQKSNWEADILNNEQKIYAATDAWACLMIYTELEKLRKTHNYNLIETCNEIQENNS